MENKAVAGKNIPPGSRFRIAGRRLLLFAHLLLSISVGTGVAYSQTNAPKDVDGWSKANWGMTAEQVIDAFKVEGAHARGGFGLQCDSAVEISPFQFGTQEKNSAVAKAKFRVTFDMDRESHRLCRITISPIRAGSIRFSDVKAMLTKVYGEPKSEEIKPLISSRAYWQFPSTTIGLFDVGDDPDISFYPEQKEEHKKLFTPLTIQSNVGPALPAPQRQQGETSPGKPSAILSGKAFLITDGGDLMLARFAHLFVLSGEAATQFSKHAEFVNYQESIDFLQAIGPNSGIEQAMLRLQCVENLMKHFEMAGDLKKAYPSSVVISETDDEGAFKVNGLRPDTYTVLVFGRAGANAALWMDQVSLENGKDDPLKMRSMKLSCFDPQGRAKF